MSCEPEWMRQGLPCPHGFEVPLPFSTFTLPREPRALDCLAALFCTLPFDWLMLWLFLAVKCRGLRELALGTLLLWNGLAILVFQTAVLQPRPTQSCLGECGMPSGHAMMCLSLTVFTCCELLHRWPPSLQRFGAILLLVLTHLPVTWAKLHVHDHTFEQVSAGASLGCLLGVGHFLAVRKCFDRGGKVCKATGLVDNYWPQEGYAPLP
ncbi:unnamed protein product [Effrenium voratum]|uniref:Phosphatidic acid phosphatase type 2/haloperoxidase domain-containing protein n=1 Tax=Effrenium voratum TaxID=2562239 RepID=A0AA36JTZ2_9DINO|nr:unnamed protein product [Effrenium voratum]CAJ1456780.1 unnamed protein product [Effrenium voratum]